MMPGYKNFAASCAELSTYETSRVAAFEHGAVTAAACLSCALWNSELALDAEAWAIQLGYDQGDDWHHMFCEGFNKGVWGKPTSLRRAAHAAVRALNERKAMAGVTLLGCFRPRLVSPAGAHGKAARSVGSLTDPPEAA